MKMEAAESNAECFCAYCGATGFNHGVILDMSGWSGDRSTILAWVKGSSLRLFFEGAKSIRADEQAVETYRCQACGHLELFVQPS